MKEKPTYQTKLEKLLNKILTKFGFRFVFGIGIFRIIDPLANIDKSKLSHAPFGIIHSTDPHKIKKIR